MRKQVVIFSAGIIIWLNGYSADANNIKHESVNKDTHALMVYSSHSNSRELPRGLREIHNPTYKIGSKEIIKANHMEGMNKAKAIIVGAYATTAYAVSYQPTTGGKKVKNHKWVVQEEIKNSGDKLLRSGKKVILEAKHMKGMNGALAEIDFSKKTTVYMIDYTPTTGGKEVKNHKWVIEDELSVS